MVMWGDQVAYFSGLMKKKSVSERVLARVSLDEDKGHITLQLHCDDALLSATLLDVVKRGLSSSHTPRSLYRSGGSGGGLL
jgi:hypothetical protein